MLHLRCLTGFWICLCLRLASLKLYLFSRNIKSRLSYQFWKLFTVVIRTKSYDKIMAMSIILGNHNNINSWRNQERAFLLCFHSQNYFTQSWCVSWHLRKISRFQEGLGVSEDSLSTNDSSSWQRPAPVEECSAKNISRKGR